MTLYDLLNEGSAALQQAGDTDGENDAKLLLFEALHLDLVHFLMDRLRPLSEQERNALLTIAEGMKKAVPCTACRYCVEGCPKHIAIPDYFALYNADRQSVNHLFSIQQTYYDNLAQTHGRASECIGCRKCERSCPQHLPIVDDLKRVAATFETAG